MASRYYDSSSEGEIKPGKISNELRQALDLPRNEVPIWIYRMRALGYPPGWLKKAVVDTSDIFDTDTSNDSKKRRDTEQDQVQYDHSKLIEYPGFNSPMPEGCIDYHYYINMPAMLEHQQLDYAKKHMNSFTAAPMPKRIRIEQTGRTSGEFVDTSCRTDTTNDPESPDEDSEGSASDTKLKKSKSSMSLPEEIKLVSKGSPMPKPVVRAPLEKFSEGVVGELLYFENLPQSTGKFECIRGLLNTIRRSKSEADTSYEEPKPSKDETI